MRTDQWCFFRNDECLEALLRVPDPGITTGRKPSPVRSQGVYKGSVAIETYDDRE